MDGDDGPLEGHGRSFGYGHGGWGRVMGAMERDSSWAEWGKEETIANCWVGRRGGSEGEAGWLLTKTGRKEWGVVAVVVVQVYMQESVGE